MCLDVCLILQKSCRKLAEIRSNIIVGRSGSTPDAQAVTDAVLHYVDQHEFSLNAVSSNGVSVPTVASAVSQFCYQNRQFNSGRGLMAAMIVAGYDAYAGGQVYNVPLGGTLVRSPGWAVEGSGSTPIFSKFDSEWIPNMSREAAEEFMLSSIALAISRDSGCGGCIRLVTITADGQSRRFVPGNEIPSFLEERDIAVPMSE